MARSKRKTLRQMMRQDMVTVKMANVENRKRTSRPRRDLHRKYCTHIIHGKNSGMSYADYDSMMKRQRGMNRVMKELRKSRTRARKTIREKERIKRRAERDAIRFQNKIKRQTLKDMKRARISKAARNFYLLQ